MTRLISFCRGFGGLSVAFFWLACAKPPQLDSRGPVDPIAGAVPDLGAAKLVGSSIREASNVVDTELVGATPGELDVSNAGSAQYRIEVKVPPGTAGMQPKLSIDYDSSGGNGLLGLGFSVSGIPRVTRCPRAIDPDWFIDGVDFDDNDLYCLDGARLVAAVGAYGASGTEYRTEIESFQRIISHGQAAGGPEWFQVYTKDGRILEFGRTADSRIEAQGRAEVHTWTMNKAEDRSGTYMTITYGEDNNFGLWAPSRIDYSGHAAANVSPYNHLEFGYELRPDHDVGYMSGSRVCSIGRLNRIYTYAGELLVREYRLAYDQAPSNNRSRLISVTECGAGNACLRPTRFDWGVRGAGFGRVPLRVGFQASVVPGGVSSYFDANGDGAVDKVWTPCGVPGNYTCNTELHIFAALSTGNGFGPPQLWLQNGTGGVPNSSAGHQHEGFADFDGDGLQDFWVIPHIGGEQLYVARNTSRSFEAPKVWLGPQQGVSIRSDNGKHGAMVDLNGDGRTDYVWIPAGTQQIRAALSTGQNLAASQIWLGTAGPSLKSSEAKHERFIDLNADRMADRVWIPEGSNNMLVALSTGAAFELPRNWLLGGTSGVNPLSPSGRHEDFADVNGDGYPDFLFIPDDAKDDLYVATSTGTGFLPPTVWLSDANARPAGNPDFGPIPRRSSDRGPRDEQYVDFNGDGSADRVWTPYSNYERLYISISNRITGFGPPIPATLGIRCRAGIPKPDVEPAAYVDVTGDGTPDRVWIPSAAAPDDLPCNAAEPLNVWLEVGGSLNDHVVGITDGAAKRDEVTYVSSVDPKLYVPERPQYPQVEFRDAQALVAELRRSDGVGGFHTATFRYGGLKNDVLRQRDLGFSFIEQSDQQRQTKTTTRYNQQFPIDHTDRVIETSLASNNQVLTRTTSQWRSKSIAGQGPVNVRHRVYLETTTDESFELDGTLFASRTNTRTYDDFGNVRTTDSSTSDGFGKKSIYGYENNAIAWLLGLVTSSTLTSTAPDTPPITRSTRYEYYPTGLEKKRTIEPMTNLELVREYERDAFGNVIKETASGANIEKRSVETKYDVRGRFPTTLVNALGHPTAQSFDGRFGALASTTDPNQLTSTQTYNALGQPDVATDADGTKTFTSRVYCSTSSCALNGSISVTAQRQGKAAVTSVLDVKGREIRTITTGTDGRTIFTETEYDRVGRVKATASPYYEGEAAQRTINEYDAYDRVILETKPDKSRTKTDHHGNRRTMTNALEQTRTEVRNSQDQLVSVTDAYDKTTTYHYDATGNLTSVTDPIKSTIVLTYDNLGRRLTITDPDLGFRESDYDVLGQLIANRDADGKGATFRYDVLGRPKERTEPEGVTTWVYDTAPNGVGKLARVYTNGIDLNAFEQSLSYDSLSRLSVTTTSIGGRTFTVGREYDSFSRPSVVTYPSGLKVRSVYSPLGYLARVENVAEPKLYWKADEYNAMGNVIRSTLGNGLSTTLRFNPATNRLEGVRTGTKGGAETQQLKYEWSSVGTLKGREDINQGLKESFLYDDLNRLTDATIPNRQPLTLKYDDAGNVREKSDVGIYKYDEGNAGPHAVSSTDGVTSVRYLYDNKGNQTARTDGEGRSLAEMRYSSFDKPIFIERDGSRSDFVYGTNKELIVRSDANVDAARGGNRVIRHVEGLFEEIVDPSTEAVSKRHYVRAGGHTVAVYNEGQNGSSSTAGTRYVLTDHLGSVDVLTDETGAVAERNSFDAFGKRRNADWTPAPVATLFSSLDKGFTGHEQLDHLGLVHMGARVYDPQIGRFTSADPTIPKPDSTQGYNRYTYVDNSPLSKTDPSGFFGVDARQRFFDSGRAGFNRFLGRSGVFFPRPGGCVLPGSYTRFVINTASIKEGGVPKEGARSQAFGEDAEERPTACTGPSCDEVVAVPATVRNKIEKEGVSTSQTGESRPDPYSVKSRIGDQTENRELQDAAAKAVFIANEDLPASPPLTADVMMGLGRAAGGVAMGAQVREAKRQALIEKAFTFARDGKDGLDAYNANLERQGSNLNNAAAAVGGTIGGTIGGAIGGAFTGPAAPGGVSAGAAVGATVGAAVGGGIAYAAGSEIIANLKADNQALFNRVLQLEVVNGEVMYKAAFRAYAK